MNISIIIPTLNEAKNIARLIEYLIQYSYKAVKEIIVSDGGSSDDTMQLVIQTGASFIKAPEKCRAVQMNYGASVAQGDILYFVHADTFPPVTFATDILEAVGKGYDFGRYRTQFAGNNWLLKVNAFFTRYDWFICHGGDQTLFIKKKVFHSINGYNEGLLIMEEYDLAVRAKKAGRYKIIPKTALVSTRKYEQNTWWQVQRANYTIVKLYQRGVKQEALVKRYNELIRYR